MTEQSILFDTKPTRKVRILVRKGSTPAQVARKAQAALALFKPVKAEPGCCQAGECGGCCECTKTQEEVR